MTIPTGTIIAQGQILYRKQPDGQQPTIFTVSCNCSSSVKERTARFIDQNRSLFLTSQQFIAGEWK